MSKSLLQRVFWTISLRVKVLIPVLFTVITLFGLGQFFSTMQSIEMKTLQQIERLKSIGSRLTHSYPLTNAGVNVDAIRLGLDLIPELTHIAIYSTDGQLRVLLKGATIDVSKDSWQKMTQADSWQTDTELIVTVVIPEQEGEAVLVMRSVKTDITLFIQKALYHSILFLGAFLVVWMVFYLTFNRLVLNPISQLSIVMQQVTNRHQRDHLNRKSGRDEMELLFNSFTHMLERSDAKEDHVIYALRKLNAEKDFANKVLDTIRFATLVVDSTGVIVHHNKAAEELFSEHTGELLDTDIKAMTHGDLTIEAIFESLTLPRNVTFNMDKVLNIHSTKLPEVNRYLVCIENITEIEQSTERHRVASSVFENNAEAMMIVDCNNLISMVNSATTTLIGLDKQKCIGKTPQQVFASQQFNQLSTSIELSLNRYGFWQGEISQIAGDGRTVPLLVKASQIARSRNSDKVDYFYMFSDLSSVKEMERLSYLAHHDALTGLANRTKLYLMMENALSDPNCIRAGFAILYIDLDGFKLVNDKYGHDAGDFVLQQVASRMLAQVRIHDCVARLAGDEFVIMLRHISQQDVEGFAQRLTEDLSQPMIFCGQSMFVGASIGINYSTDSNTDLGQLLKQADSAMYRVKRVKKEQA